MLKRGTDKLVGSILFSLSKCLACWSKFGCLNHCLFMAGRCGSSSEFGSVTFITWTRHLRPTSRGTGELERDKGSRGIFSRTEVEMTQYRVDRGSLHI